MTERQVRQFYRQFDQLDELLFERLKIAVNNRDTATSKVLYEGISELRKNRRDIEDVFSTLLGGQRHQERWVRGVRN